MAEPSTALDRAMSKRRIDLGMKWREVAAAAGISYETLRALRRGANDPSPLTKRGVERALRWAPGGFDEAVAGREPAPATSAAERPYPDPSDPDERIIWDMNVPEETRRTLIELLRRDKERLRRAG